MNEWMGLFLGLGWARFAVAHVRGLALMLPCSRFVFELALRR